LTARGAGFEIALMNSNFGRHSRRRFLFTSTVAASGLMLTWSSSNAAPAANPKPRTISPNEKLNIAAVGAGGQAATDIAGVATENIVALCDIDETRLRERGSKFPKARLFRDYRKMLEEVKEIEAVTVSTPDHHHAPASLLAMNLGKHVYCQKPLAHSIHEARVLRQTARARNVITQMGNQGHSYDSTRRVVEIVQSGALGEIREVHVWTDRAGSYWPQGMDRPKETPPVPANIDWDLWLGPAPQRPYHPAYLHFKWRGWWDFGTGAIGDMACHNADAAFWALKLEAPASVEAESSGVHAESPPVWSIIRYQFPARGKLPPVLLTWYDGGKMPKPDLAPGMQLAKNGTVIVGSEGRLVFRDWNPDKFVMLPEKKFADFKGPEVTLPRAPKGPYQEWITACKGGPMCLSNFDYSGPLTEAMLLGNVALRVGKRIEWDAEGMKAKGCPEADPFIHREYRKGWTV